ncbi:MAG: DNA replication and repair protein RecF [Bacteroidia bacterium]|nr:DNA replication and repair protein RecF [Bacteroidia bacterium]
MKRIRIDLLRINGFRNYENLKTNFHSHINVITGLNGAGKTSIIDSIYYLSNGRSYFTHLDSVLYKRDTDFFNLNADIFIEEDLYEIGISSSAKNKSIKVDDVVVKSIAEFYGRYPSLMIAPKDILILLDSSIERRKLIDKTISKVDKVYFKNLLIHNKLLKQRNSALKGFLKSGRRDTLLIEALNQKMVEPTEYIYKKRSEYLNDIAPIINKFYALIASDREEVSIAYKTKLAENDLLQLFKDSEQRDYAMAKTYEGIHRDDLIIKLDDKEIKKFGSQGQLKSAIISIKLAQLEWVKNQTSRIPILLLDDIFDKLDKSRVFTFLKLCAEDLNSQIFITDTDEDRVVSALKKLNLDYNHYIIEQGQIVA